MEAHFDIFPEDHKALKAHTTNHPSFAGLIAFTLLVLCFVCHYILVPALVLLLAGASSEAWFLGMVLVIGQGLCLVFFTAFAVLFAKRKPKKEFDRNVTMTIDAYWFRLETTSEQVALRWTAIQRIEVTDQHAFFFTGPQTAYVLPRRAFSDAESFHQFLGKARSFFEAAKVPTESPTPKT
jgi:hypothetical protein